MNYINTLSGYRMSDDWADHIARGSRGGIDYATGMNTPIPAPIAGRLENRPDNGNGFGNYIRFHHGNGFVDEYLHLNSFVGEGNYAQGQVIGYTGNTGNSTGPHVHWHLIDPSGRRVNPLDYVQGGSGGAPSSSGISASMAAAQQILANVGLYSGAVDGVFGPKSWRAAQTWLAKYGMYDGVIDGVPGPKTYRGVQMYGQKNGNYAPPGVIDGVLGPLSWAGFVQSLKEDTAPAPVKPPVVTPPVVTPPVVVPPVVTPPVPEKPETVVPEKPVKPVKPPRPTKPTKPVKEPTVSNVKPLPDASNSAAQDALGILIPKAKNRKLAYALYGLVSLVVSNVSIGIVASGLPAPAWMIVLLAVVGNLAAPFAALAIANAGNSNK
jgi:peptidoglycan hydrolase-like protein with peptidoglycan-binding domain